MIVYRVTSDLDYQAIDSDEHKYLFKLTSGLAEPLGDVTFPKCHISSYKDKRGNFFRLTNGNLTLDENALSVVKPVMPNDTEYFPVSVEDEGEVYYANLMVKVDALDADNCSWRKESDGKRKIILGYQFHAEKLESVPCLFKIPEHRYTRLFTVTNRSVQADDFYTRYHDAGLTGLTFEKLWDDES